MNLFIRVYDNHPVEHPITENNLKLAFPNIDINNLPNNFVKFLRIPMPNLSPYEVCVGCTYEWDGNFIKDVWHTRLMTEEEKQEKINKLIEYQPFPSWTFNFDIAQWEAPVPMPEGDGMYSWDEATGSWVVIEMETENGN